VEALQEYGRYEADSAPGRRPEAYWKDYPEAPVRVAVVEAALPARALTAEEAAARLAREQALSPVVNELKEAIISGNALLALDKTRQALEAGIAPGVLINEAVMPAMQAVGDKFECGEYFLPEMMASAIGTQGVMKLLRPRLIESGIQPVASAVIGTVKGDLHDIGKNMVAMLWEGAGFNVIDLGHDVPPERFVKAIQENQPQLVGLSALLTTTMPMMSRTIKAIEAAGLRDRVKIMVGGAGVTQAFAAQIGADDYAPDAASAVRRARALLAVKS
jgi:5-methyltetrahydrofolate--homocysteine methyltransferase